MPEHHRGAEHPGHERCLLAHGIVRRVPRRLRHGRQPRGVSGQRVPANRRRRPVAVGVRHAGERLDAVDRRDRLEHDAVVRRLQRALRQHQPAHHLAQHQHVLHRQLLALPGDHGEGPERAAGLARRRAERRRGRGRARLDPRPHAAGPVGRLPRRLQLHRPDRQPLRGHHRRHVLRPHPPRPLPDLLLGLHGPLRVHRQGHLVHHALADPHLGHAVLPRLHRRPRHLRRPRRPPTPPT